MASVVTLGHLDGLVGVTFNTNSLVTGTLQSDTTTGPATAPTLATSELAIGETLQQVLAAQHLNYPGVTIKVTAVDDATNTITGAAYYGTVPVYSIQASVVGFRGNAVELLYPASANAYQPGDWNSASTTGYGALGPDIGNDQGDTLGFSLSGRYGVTAAVSQDYVGDGKSDILLQNGSAVVVAEVTGGVAAYTTIATLGSDWSFYGSGDFMGYGNAQFLLRNANGAVAVGEVTQGQASYVPISALGTDWKFLANGDLLGDGKDGFLVQNTNGALLVGEVVNGAAAYTLVGGLGAGWNFYDVGAFLGDGKDGVLMRNANGAIVVGEVVSGAETYKTIGALGSDWTIEQTGDFLGDGKTDVLLHNTNGAVVVGEVNSAGALAYTTVGGLGADWSFVGAGDYSGTGKDSFLIESQSTGALVTGTVVAGQAQYAQVGALGAGWKFQG